MGIETPRVLDVAFACVRLHLLFQRLGYALLPFVYSIAILPTR